MKVILTKNVESLGEPGALVNVSDGFARNCLIPKRLAVIADERSMKMLAHQKKMIDDQRKRELATIKDQLAKIESKSITITKHSGEQDKLFGSVTTADIIEALEKEGINFIDKRQVYLEEPIKQLGVYTIPVRLATNHTAQLKLFVVSES